MVLIYVVVVFRGGFIPFLKSISNRDRRCVRSMTGCHRQNEQPVFIVLIHIRFFPLRRFRGEATGLHPIQRKTTAKVAGNFGGNGVAK